MNSKNVPATRKVVVKGVVMTERRKRLTRIVADLLWVHRENDFGNRIPCPEPEDAQPCPVCATIGKYQRLLEDDRT